MLVSVGVALVAFAVWFFGFAGSSLPTRLPGRRPSPPRRIPGVHVIVLGIDPGVANTGYGIVAHDRGRLVALDGGVVETARGAGPGRRLAHDPPPRRRVDGRLQAGRGGRRGPLLRHQRALGVRGRPGPRRRHPRRRPARDPLHVLHAPAGQDGGLRLRPRRQGAGPAHGPDAARAARSCRRPTTPPTRSRSRSATPTARRWPPRWSRSPDDRAASRARSRSAAATTSSSPAAASATGSRSRRRRCATSRASASRRRSTRT